MIATTPGPPAPPSPSPAPVPASARVRVRMPTWLRWGFVAALPGGRVVTVTQIWVTRSHWRRRPESSEPGWGARAVGPFVLATRVEG